MDLFRVEDLIAANAPTEFGFVGGGGFTLARGPVVEMVSESPLERLPADIATTARSVWRDTVRPFFEEGWQSLTTRNDERTAVPITYREDDGVWSWWSRTKDNLKRSTLTVCCGGHIVADWDREITFDRAVRHEMLNTTEVPVDQALSGYLANSVSELNAQRVQHIPKLVANVTVALRMKLGVGAMDRSVPGNVVLVRAEAARMLRDWNVRTMDAAAHLLLIERCFFRDDTHYQITTWRAKACAKSRFVGWILGKEDNVSFDF